MIGARAGRVARLVLFALVSLASGCGGAHDASSNDGGAAGMAVAGGGASGGGGSGRAGASGGSSGSGVAGVGGGSAGGAASAGAGGHLASGPWLPLTSTDNATTLTGMPVGSCASGSLFLRKKIPLIVNGGSSDFQIGDAYLLADSMNLSSATLMAPVKNVGTSFHCGISSPINGYDWLDADGHSLNVTYGVQFIGSEGDVGSDINDETCLAPGETGFVMDTQRLVGVADLYDEVGTVTLALVSKVTGKAPGAILAAQTYTYDSGLLDVVFENVGTAGAVIQASTVDFGAFIVFDADGLPLWTGILEETVDQAPLNNPGYVAVGATGQGLAPISSNDQPPCGPTIRAFLKFEGASAPWD